MLPLVAALLLAADPDPAKALEDRITRSVAAAERGVAAVLVSHRDYKDGLPTADKPWLLGDYQPQGIVGPGGRFFPQPTAGNRLNLADPSAAADNTFGSGLVLAADGRVLTAYHLIEGATKIYVRTPGGGGSYANLHAADARSDLAVLKLIDPPPNLKPVRLADVRTARGPRGEPATVRKGQFVIALGHPLAAGAVDGGPSASWGILSNLRRRTVTAGAGDTNRNRPLASYAVLLQTDARVTLGCSGGGLFNLEGEAIGMTSSTAGVTGADTAGGYAVPFDHNVRRAVDALLAGREVEYGFLGVTMGGGFGFPPPAGPGVTLSGVTPGMPAAVAGLRKDDRLVSVDDQPVADSDDLFLNVGAALAGAEVRVGFVRPPGEQRQTVRATLAKHKHDLRSIASQPRPAVFGLRPDWSSVLVVEQGATTAGLPPGVLVQELEPDSPAEAKLKAFGEVARRWLVTAVDGQPVPTPAAFAAAAAGKDRVRLTLFDPGRPEQPLEVTLP